jgi:hypothetical protein
MVGRKGLGRAAHAWLHASTRAQAMNSTASAWTRFIPVENLTASGKVATRTGRTRPQNEVWTSYATTLSRLWLLPRCRPKHPSHPNSQPLD